MDFFNVDFANRIIIQSLSRYFGGIASAMAAACTHPLDLLKVHLQTTTAQLAGARTAPPATLITSTFSIVRHQGVIALYNGLSASLLRQLTYSTTRFAAYETVKNRFMRYDANGLPYMPFYQKVALAAVSGAVGGAIGTPADMVNVRMQNDIKMPLDKRRKYAIFCIRLTLVHFHYLIFSATNMPLMDYGKSTKLKELADYSMVYQLLHLGLLFFASDSSLCTMR